MQLLTDVKKKLSVDALFNLEKTELAVSGNYFHGQFVTQTYAEKDKIEKIKFGYGRLVLNVTLNKDPNDLKAEDVQQVNID